MDKLKGKKIALVYHDSPFGKEPIRCCKKRAPNARLELQMLPVTGAWRGAKIHLAANAPKPPRLRAAVGLGRDELHRPEGSAGHGLPRDKMYGVWWAGCRSPTCVTWAKRQGLQRPGTSTATAPPPNIQGHPQAGARQNRGTGPKDEVGSVLYTRGVIIQMLSVEAMRARKERFGKGNP